MKLRTVGALFTGCIALGALASACNALSGVNDFAVVADAGVVAAPDEGVGEGSSGADATSNLEGGGADVHTSADGARDGETGGPGDATTDSTDGAGSADGDAGGGGPSDAAPDTAMDTGAGTKEAGSEAGGCAVSSPVCDAGCPTAHANGLGQVFYDCAPLGTINETQAFEACIAFTGSGTLCFNDPMSCANADQVCSSGASTCACWSYRGLHAGVVFASTTATCSCYVAGAPSWN